MNGTRTVVFVAALALVSCKPGAPEAQRVPDGRYYGYEGMPNLAPTEDPDAYWYHELVLEVHGDQVTIETKPYYRSRGNVVDSASDGGFASYRGTIEFAGKRTLVRLRKIACDYCGIPVNDPLPSKIEREYVVRFIEGGSFELDRVIYSLKPNPLLEPRSR